MNKDFLKEKLLSFSEQKQIKTLYDLASFIEETKATVNSNHFEKLQKYHEFLKDTESTKLQKLNKEFAKIAAIDYQFQVYLMNLERLLGQSKKEYEFVTNLDGKHNKIKRFPIICICDSVRSAHNIGAMIRNAECFGVEKIILTGLSPTPENPQVKKTTMGSDEVTDWEYCKSAVELVRLLKKDGHTIWSIETAQNSCSIHSIESIPKNLVLIFGHEQFGVSNELIQLSDKIVSIELYGQKNSLNVAISQAIVLDRVTQLIINA